MTKELSLAFDHPLARAMANPQDDDPRDRISLRDHVVAVEIGAFQSERGATQRLRFNVVVELSPLPAPLDDDVDRVLSYDTITDAIAEALADERLNLLETLAEKVAQRLLVEPQPLRVFVRIEKLDRGPGALGVEIERRRASTQPQLAAATPQLVVVYLDNAAIHAAELPQWLDRLDAGGAPVVLCVGAADVAAPRSASEAAQRRIDLLAIEQNSWVLAGRDRRCVVTNSRTEIDWAIKNAHICVWAPSKIVLDQVDGPTVDAADAIGLSQWFAAELNAQRFCIVGAGAPPKGGAIKAEIVPLDCASALL